MNMNPIGEAEDIIYDLQDAKFEILEVFQAVRDAFDGSEYMQGKKDGLRIALSLLGSPDHASLIRGNKNARVRSKASYFDGLPMFGGE